MISKIMCVCELGTNTMLLEAKYLWLTYFITCANAIWSNSIFVHVYAMKLMNGKCISVRLFKVCISLAERVSVMQ